MRFILVAIFFPFYFTAYTIASAFNFDAKHDMPTPSEWAKDIKNGLF